MLSKLGGYRTALWFAFSIAITSIMGWGAISIYDPSFTNGAAVICALSLGILFGLWTQDRFVRYFGAIWMIILAGVLIWALVSSGAAPFINRPIPTSLLFLFYTVSAVMNLWTAAILLLSKRFTVEFAQELERRPNYKIYLNWLMLAAVFLAMLIATFIDNINLTSN